MTMHPVAIRSPLLQAVSRAHPHFFAERSHQRHYPKGSRLFSMGDPALHLSLVVDGWVKLYRVHPNGEETVIHIFGPGESFGEAAVFGAAQRYPVNAQAVEDATILEIPRMVFVNHIREDSEFALSLIGSIAAHQHTLVQQIERLTIKDAHLRLASFLLQLCSSDSRDQVTLNLPYDKSLIAKRLNMQPETFSRALKKLESYGVTTHGKTVLIQDPNLLVSLCARDPGEHE